MPPLDDVEDMDADSSAASNLDDAGKEKPTKAEPSPATDETDGDELASLNVVRDVFEEKPEKPAAAPSAKGEEAGQEAGDQTPKVKEPDNENYTDVPFHKHPRFRHLLNELHTQRPEAERYRNVERFLTDNGLSAEEAADALTTRALMKTDPNKAWEQLKPHVQELLARVGEVLPEDLKQRVAAGEMTAEAAKEVSRARATVKSTEEARTFEQQQAARRQQAETQTAIASAATTWETDRRLKDPNFDAKVIPLQKEIAFLQLTEGKPKDAAGVEDQLKRAYEAVNSSFQPVQPTTARRPAVRPVNGGQVAGNTRPEVGSTLDVIRNVRAGRA